ncbi:uncharacterized protein [Miscanthus floridulus]|uniref:uncharacterized protein isoform X2 n=1 Tax=Miscanthus floridulus TaxID=154761 RepID=UPI003457B843
MTHARLLRPALLTYETASSSSAPCPSAPATSARLQDSATAGVPSSSAPLLAAGRRGGRAPALCGVWERVSVASLTPAYAMREDRDSNPEPSGHIRAWKMVKSNRGGDGLTRSSKRNERVGDLTRTYFTRSSKKNTPYLTRSSTKNRTIDNHTRSSKKNKISYPARRSTKDKPICNEGEKTGLPISVHGDGFNGDRFGDLESLGYPERPETMLTDCILVNSFEEPFGDTHDKGDKGVWSELKETVATNIDENIVALASFNGEKRFFCMHRLLY